MNNKLYIFFFKLLTYIILFISTRIGVNNLIENKTGDSFKYLYFLRAGTEQIFPEPTWIFIRNIFDYFGEYFLLNLLTFFLATSIYLCVRKFDRSLITGLIFSIFLIIDGPNLSIYSSFFSTWRAIPGWLAYFILHTFFIDPKSSIKGTNKIRRNFFLRILEILLLIICLFSHSTIFFILITTYLFYFDDSLILNMIYKLIYELKILIPKQKFLFIIFLFISIISSMTFLIPDLNSKLYHYLSYKEINYFTSLRAILINLIISFFGIKYNNKFSRVIFGASILSLPITIIIPSVSYRIAITLYWISFIDLISTSMKLLINKQKTTIIN